jgi:hypothetical protein
MKIVFFVLITSTLVGGAAKSGKQTPISVCELLENRLKYDGEIVEVRGIVEGSVEGATLIGGQCRRTILTDGFTWPNAIFLASQVSYDSPHTVNFTRDQSQMDKTDREARRIKQKYPHAKIAYTYVGLFETRANLGQATNLAGELVPAGFGHMGACPAQLVVQTIKDPRVQSFK